MPTQKILKVGNSLGVTLPSGLVKRLSLKAGDMVEVSFDMDNSMTLNFFESHQLSLGIPTGRKNTKKG